MKKILNHDFMASFVVFLVAVPLCIGIALACGVSPVAGLLSGIIGGLVVGALGGCSLMVSGPAAGLIALVWEIVNQHGLSGLAVCVIGGGILQLVLGALKLGQLFRAVSPAVVQGMLAGIGALIFCSQLHVVLDATPVASGIANFMALPAAFVDGLLLHAGTKHQHAAIIGTLTIFVIVAWKFAPKRFSRVPGVLIAVLFATAIAQAFSLEIDYVTTPESLIVLPDIFSSKYWLNTDLSQLIIPTIGLAFIATAETLLTATATDKLHTGPKTDYNKEVMAQGVGNILSGALGALPITGVIVRSAANVQSGGKTRASSILHSVWLVVFLVLLPGVLALIPVASLAAALVYTGWKLMNPIAAKMLLAHSRVELAIYLITLGGIFVFGMLSGVVAGFACALAHLVYNLNHLQISVHEDSGATVINMQGSATFLTLPKISDTLDAVPKDSEVHVLVHDVNYIDHAVLDLLLNWEIEYVKNGGDVQLEWDTIHRRTVRPLTNGAVSEQPLLQ